MLKRQMFRICGRVTVQFLTCTENLWIGRTIRRLDGEIPNWTEHRQSGGKRPGLDAKFAMSTEHGQIGLKRGGSNVQVQNDGVPMLNTHKNAVVHINSCL